MGWNGVIVGASAGARRAHCWPVCRQGPSSSVLVCCHEGETGVSRKAVSPTLAHGCIAVQRVLPTIVGRSLRRTTCGLRTDVDLDAAYTLSDQQQDCLRNDTGAQKWFGIARVLDATPRWAPFFWPSLGSHTSWGRLKADSRQTQGRLKADPR